MKLRSCIHGTAGLYAGATPWWWFVAETAHLIGHDDVIRSVVTCHWCYLYTCTKPINLPN